MTGIDQLENLPLSQLFAGPLVAAIDASVQSQTETVDLLLEAGYEDDGTLRTVDFTYTSPERDPDTDEYRRLEKELQVPLLLFLAPPNLQITRIEEEFSARITEVQETETSSTPGRIVSPYRLGVKAASRSTERNRERRSKFDLDVRMVAELTNESTGMELLERAANNGIVERTAEDEPERPNGGTPTHHTVAGPDGRSFLDEPE